MKWIFDKTFLNIINHKNLINYSSPTFFSSWLLIELIILIFLGLSYSIFQNSLSNLITFFLIQTLASLTIFISFFTNIDSLLILSIILKLRIFPLHIWFLSVSYRFPNIILFLVSTYHKLPVFYIISSFLCLSTLQLSLLLFRITMSLIVSGITMSLITDSRLLLVTSSLGNNTWFIASSIISFTVFLLFIFIYSILLYSTLSTFLSQSKPVASNNLLFCINMIILSALPPSPLFFVKVYIVIMFVLTHPTEIPTSYLIPILISASTMLIGYLTHIFKYFTNFYRSTSNTILLIN